MWDKKLADLASQYPTGVLTFVEPSGYPISARTNTQFDEAGEMIHFPEPPLVAMSWRGKACILFHHHNEHLEGLRQLVIKGELVDDGESGKPVLRVTEFVTANGRTDSDELPHAGAPLHMFQFLLLVRRKAREYMQKRGAPWPPIPFDEIGRKVNAAE
jgi:hypothetical protein